MKPLYGRIYSGCYQNPVSSNPAFFDLESGFSTVESGFLKRESEHESGFFPSPGFLRVRVRVPESGPGFEVCQYIYIPNNRRRDDLPQYLYYIVCIEYHST